MSTNLINLPGSSPRSNDPHQFVADNLAAELARRRISGRQAAKKLGLSQPYVARRVSGDIPLDVNDIFAFSRLLGINPEVLLTGGSGSDGVGPAGIEPTTSTVGKTWDHDAEIIPLFSAA